MEFIEKINYEEMRALLDASLEKFYRLDGALLDYDAEDRAVAERCIVFRIGWHMLEEMKTHPYLQWADLDCEYNRNFKHPKSMYKQVLRGIKVKIKDAIPDLLIHKRLDNKYNLLIIEFKKGKPTPAEKSKDIEKLVYFTKEENEYGYRFGFYVELYKRCANVSVYEKGKHKSHNNYTWRPTS